MTDVRLLALIEAVAPSARLVRSWPLTGGISAQMTAFEIERPDGGREKLIARQPRWAESAAEGFRTLTLLQETGLPAPRPVHLGEGIFLIEYLEGNPEFAPDDVSAFLDRYAEMLTRIHHVANLDLSFLPPQGCGYGPRPESPNDTLRETEVRDALESVGPIVRSNPPTLRHGDFWPGNVLWRDGEITGVIDWEEARVGEPLADLAICRLDLLWVFGMEAMDEFTLRYQAHMELDMADLPYWDLCASLRPIQNIHEWAPSYPGFGRPDVTEATMRRDHAAFVAQALAALSR